MTLPEPFGTSSSTIELESTEYEACLCETEGKVDSIYRVQHR